MPWLETIKLHFDNNLILGNKPKRVTMEQVSNKISKQPTQKADLMSFGLFDTNTSNFNTFYPNVTTKDLKPKDSDFVYPIYRALSEVIVHKDWNPVDFSMNGVLKKSLYLLLGQSVKADHDSGISTSLGAVSEVAWQDSYKVGSKGIMVPAGINAQFKIDGKSNPRIARAIMMDPPAIHSTSVTVRFLWEKSHASLTSEEFFDQLGKYDKDGKLVRRIATSVKNYNEISLVDHGADPYAQKINGDGKINNPEYAAIDYGELSVKQKKGQKYFMFDFKTDILSNSKKITIPKESINNNNSAMNKKLIAILVATLGIQIDATKPNLNEIKAAIKKLALAPKKLKVENAKLKAEAEKAEGLKAFKTKLVKSLRAQTLKNYSLSVKGTIDPVVKEMLETASHKTLTALNKQYIGQLAKDMPLSCKECGSKNINRASGVASDDDGEATKSKLVAADDMQDRQLQRYARKAIKSMHNA
jgi:hypothetical protein